MSRTHVHIGFNLPTEPPDDNCKHCLRATLDSALEEVAKAHDALEDMGHNFDDFPFLTLMYCELKTQKEILDNEN